MEGGDEKFWGGEESRRELRQGWSSPNWCSPSAFEGVEIWSKGERCSLRKGKASLLSTVLGMPLRDKERYFIILPFLKFFFK